MRSLVRRLTMTSLERLSLKSLESSVKVLARQHPEFAIVYERYGVPPLWDRAPGFATLLKIILEQQVSLASAKACFDRLAARLGTITPISILNSTDTELKRDGFSRQKTGYARHLADAVHRNQIDLDGLAELPDEHVKAELTRLKGVGEWTSDIYLLMALLRPDVMPRGDIALHQAYRRLTRSEQRPSSDDFLRQADAWRPHRSTAARLLWHFYLSERAARTSVTLKP